MSIYNTLCRGTYELLRHEYNIESMTTDNTKKKMLSLPLYVHGYTYISVDYIKQHFITLCTFDNVNE